MQCFTGEIDDMAWYAYFGRPIPLYQVVGVEAGPAVVIFLFFIYLSIRLRKRAWNSPTKRFTRSFEISFILLFLIIGILSLLLVVNDDADTLIVFVVYSLPIIIISSPIFFMSFAATALLFQVVFPWLPVRIKRFLESNKVKMARICLEILVPLSFTLYVCLNIAILFVYTNQNEEGDLLVINAVLYVLYASTGTIFVISLFLSTFSFVCLILFSCILARSSMNNNTLLKLLPFFGLTLTSCLVSLALVVFFIVCNDSFEGYAINSLFCTIVIAINTLIFPRDVIWCCFKCCWRRPVNPNVRTPLLINTTQGQQTNPVSVWDHRNDPSTTATVYQPEMTDCRSDYEQIP